MSTNTVNQPDSDRVTVVIVNFNGQDLLDACLRSVDAGRPLTGGIETIVVDNASTDGSVEWLRRSWPVVTTIALTKNDGFAAGNNEGFRHARGDFVLLLNSDARLTPGALDTMIAVLEGNPDIGMVGPRLLNADGSLQPSARAFPTPWRIATEYLYLRKLAPRSRTLNHFYMGEFGYDSQRDCDFLMGACLLVRREALEQVGDMDESYFMYSEETDWARRFWDAGWRVTFCPDAEVVHLGGGSTKKIWAQMYQYQSLGHLRFLARHVSVRAARRARRIVLLGLHARRARARGEQRTVYAEAIASVRAANLKEMAGSAAL